MGVFKGGSHRINKATDSAFACLEKKTGLGDGNSIYKAIKDSIKKSIGISEGHVKGITGMITGTLQFASKNNPMLQPLRMVNKITDFVNDPNKYIDKAIAINNASNNPKTITNAWEAGKNYYSQMQADPYKAGQFQGAADANAAAKFPDSNAGSRWTAQIKVGKKLLGSDYRFYRKPNDLTHILKCVQFISKYENNLSINSVS